MRGFTLASAAMTLLLTGCVGTGSSGDTLSTATAASFADYVLLDPASGTLQPRAELPDLATNPVYRDGVIVFRRIPGGRALLGTINTESYRESDDVARYHEAAVAEHFISVFEITAAQSARLSSSATASSSSLPQASLSPAAVDTLLAAANARLRLRLRLPSATEWEYNCRAGSRGLFSWGDQTDSLISDQTAITSASGPAAVGSKAANGFGLFDMHGNVWEITTDESTDQATRFICGGSWRDPLLQARCANRAQMPTHISHPLVGFRLVLER